MNGCMGCGCSSIVVGSSSRHALVGTKYKVVDVRYSLFHKIVSVASADQLEDYRGMYVVSLA